MEEDWPGSDGRLGLVSNARGVDKFGDCTAGTATVEG
jgi:hypothetical protein